MDGPLTSDELVRDFVDHGVLTKNEAERLMQFLFWKSRGRRVGKQRFLDMDEAEHLIHEWAMENIK